MSYEDACLLTLEFPPALEENIVELLLEHSQWAPRFVCFRADGHGPAIALSGSAELVRGRSARCVVQMIAVRHEAHALVAKLREAVPSAEVAYWMVQVTETGTLA